MSANDERVLEAFDVRVIECGRDAAVETLCVVSACSSASHHRWSSHDRVPQQRRGAPTL